METYAAIYYVALAKSKTKALSLTWVVSPKRNAFSKNPPNKKLVVGPHGWKPG